MVFHYTQDCNTLPEFNRSWTGTPAATMYCCGSVLDNLTADPTTIPPQ